MPVLTLCSRPNGLPRLMTQSPTCRESESPTSTGVSVAPSASILITARSLDSSEPTTVASYESPFTDTLMDCAPSMTW